MDTISHALWSFIIFRKKAKTKSKIFLSMLFGILPDLMSWTIYMIYSLFVGTIGRPDLSKIPEWVFFLYGFSHSIFVFSAIILLIYLITKKIPIYVWAWLLHILIDIPTHSRDFLPTPFLWPISNWHFPGISWGTPWFFISEWILLIICLIYIFFFEKKLKTKNKK